MPRQTRKQLDMAATVAAYVKRMEAAADKDPQFFEPLRDKYLTTYELYSTVVDPQHVSAGLRATVHALQLMALVRARGIPVRGVTSERRKNGTFICSERSKFPDACVYVGRYNYFGGQMATSPYAVRRCDYVRKAPNPEAVCKNEQE
jgi:hypothetical protein